MKAFSKSEAEALFWNKVKKSSECWEWTGSINQHGYGNFRSRTFFPNDILAHRIAWHIYHGGPPPKGIGVLHKCDNPKCVRFDHLFLGDQFSNMRDCSSKNRHKGMTGKKHPFNRKGFKISRSDAEMIKIDHRTQIEIAASYGISRTMVSKIKNGYHWK